MYAYRCNIFQNKYSLSLFLILIIHVHAASDDDEGTNVALPPAFSSNLDRHTRPETPVMLEQPQQDTSVTLIII